MQMQCYVLGAIMILTPSCRAVVVLNASSTMVGEDEPLTLTVSISGLSNVLAVFFSNTKVELRGTSPDGMGRSVLKIPFADNVHSGTWRVRVVGVSATEFSNELEVDVKLKPTTTTTQEPAPTCNATFSPSRLLAGSDTRLVVRIQGVTRTVLVQKGALKSYNDIEPTATTFSYRLADISASHNGEWTVTVFGRAASSWCYANVYVLGSGGPDTRDDDDKSRASWARADFLLQLLLVVLSTLNKFS